MNYIFFGSPKFAAIILEKLISAGFLPKAVVCNPDRPVGRKKIITPPPVKLLAQQYNIPVYQPEFLSNSKFDFFIVASYSKILPKEILAIPRLGTIGVHPSLLPKYRGASPIQSTILNGDDKTGVTLYLVDEKLDHGPILENVECEMAKGETYESLHNKLAGLGANLLIETLPKFIRGEIKPIAQNENDATYTKKFTTEDAFIDMNNLEKAQHCGGLIAKEIDKKVRALNPEPGTWTKKDAKRVKILETSLCADGHLVLKKIQIEGKKPVELK